MKKQIIVFISLTISFLGWAQPTISNAEDFEIGTVLKFQKCNSSNVSAGNAGANQTWDFSNLNPLPDTTTEWMVDPSTTTHGNLFPSSNLVVKVSNGQFSYINKSASENNIVGFVDTTTSFPPTSYPNPMLIAKRPLDYGTIITDTFTLSGSTAIGTVILNPDAFGTLILPNGTYNNALRVKITQTHPWFSYTLYVWFDGLHKSAILKIDDQPNVEYLLSETEPIGLNEISRQKSFSFYPNPAAHQIVFTSEEKGELTIVNNLGQTKFVAPIENRQTTISTATLEPGIYYLKFRSGYNVTSARLIISNQLR